MSPLVEWPLRARTLTSYGLAVILVLVALNAVVWLVGGPPRLRGALPVFSAGFVLGMIGMYVAARVYGYHQ